MFAYLVFALDKVEKLALLGVLEHNKNVACRVDVLEVLDYVRVVEAPQHFNLALDLLKDALQLDFAFVQNFDRNFVIRDLVHRHYRQHSVNVINFCGHRKATNQMVT